VQELPGTVAERRIPVRWMLESDKRNITRITDRKGGRRDTGLAKLSTSRRARPTYAAGTS